MIAYLFENMFWNPSIIKVCILIGLSALICLVAYFILQILHKRQTLTFEEYIPLEQTVVSLLVAVWSFGLLCLPFALIVWISFYLIYPKIARRNQILNYVLKTPSKSYNSSIMEKHFRAMSRKTLLKEIFQEKKILSTSSKNTSLPTKYIPTKIYMSGVIFHFILSVVEQNTLSGSSFIWLVFLDNLVSFLGLFYSIYLLLYFVNVKHWLGEYHFHAKLFDLLAIVFLLIGIAIVIAITFWH